MPPVLLAGAVVGGGLLAKKIADNSHKPNTGARVGNFQNTPGYDANRFEYGGHPGAGDATAARYAGEAGKANTTAGQFLEQQGQDRGLGLQARGSQNDALGLMINRARGGNLVSDRMAGAARTDLGARMHSAAASAQGPAALATAQQDAMAAEAQGLGQINQQATTAGIQEQQGAEQAAFGAASGMREGDAAARGQSIAGANAMGGLGVQYGQLENQVQATRGQINTGQQQLVEGSKQSMDKLNVGIEQAGRQRDTEGMKMATGAAVGLAQTGMAASDPLAKSGVQTLGMSDSTISGPHGDTAPMSRSAPSKSARGAGRPAGQADLGVMARLPESVDIGVITGVPGAQPASDPQAKREAYLLGRGHGMEQVTTGQSVPFAYGGPVREGEDVSQRPGVDEATRQRSMQSFTRHDPKAERENEIDLSAARDMRADARKIAPYSSGPAAILAGGASFNTALSKARDTSYKPPMSRAQATSEAARHSRNADESDREASRMMATGALLPPAFMSSAEEGSRALYEDYQARKIRDENLTGPTPVPREARTTGARGLEIQTRPESTSSAQLRPPPVEADYSPYVKPASDPRAKVLGGVHDNEVSETLDATPAVSYKYKDPSYEPEAQRPGERQAGFLTTDLKKTPLGAAVVEERPDGLEGYNEHRLNGLQHAEIRNLHERLRDLETLAASLKGGGGHGRRQTP